MNRIVILVAAFCLLLGGPASAVAVNINFCQKYEGIADSTVYTLLPTPIPWVEIWTPPNADINGTIFIDIGDGGTFEIVGNGLRDCDSELAVLGAVLANSKHELHTVTYNAYMANKTQLQSCFGNYWALVGALIPGLQEVLAGLLTVGDGELGTCTEETFSGSGSFGFVAVFLEMLKDQGISSGVCDSANFVRLPEYYGPDGDFDGDGLTNRDEYGMSANAADYVQRAMTYTVVDHISIQTPAAGDAFYTNAVMDIAYTCLGDIDAVKIKLFKGTKFNRWISGPTPSTGVYRWLVPADLAPDDDYVIQIYDATDFDPVQNSGAFAVLASPLRVTAPNGGESFAAGSACAISWTAAAPAGATVKLKLFKGNQFNRWISGGTVNDGAFLWSIPADVAPGADYRIQLYDAANFALIDYSDAAFSITKPALVLSHPNGGERFIPGLPVLVHWVSDPALTPVVKLKLFKGGMFYRWIEGDLPNVNSYLWPVPMDVDAGADYQIQIYSATDYSQIDSSNACFTIGVPCLSVLSPNGGETLTAGKPVDITWHSAGSQVGQNVKLKLFRNGAFQEWIAGGTANDGVFRWTPGAGLPKGAGYQIQIYSSTNFSVIDLSDAAFGIN